MGFSGAVPAALFRHRQRHHRLRLPPTSGQPQFSHGASPSCPPGDSCRRLHEPLLGAFISLSYLSSSVTDSSFACSVFFTSFNSSTSQVISVPCSTVIVRCISVLPQSPPPVTSQAHRLAILCSATTRATTSTSTIATSTSPFSSTNVAVAEPATHAATQLTRHPRRSRTSPRRTRTSSASPPRTWLVPSIGLS